MGPTNNINPYFSVASAKSHKKDDNISKYFRARIIVAITCAIPSLFLLPFAIWLALVSLLQTAFGSDLEGMLCLAFSIAGVIGVLGAWTFVVFGKLPNGLNLLQVAAMIAGTLAILTVFGIQFWHEPHTLASFLLPFIPIPLGSIFGIFVLLKRNIQPSREGPEKP